MKKMTALLLSLMLVLSLAACGSNPRAEETESATSTPVSEETQEPEISEGTESAESSEQESEMSQASDVNAVVVYFSMPETTSPDNMTQEEDNSVVVIDGEVLGNTQYVAYVIQENTGADIFRIEPKTPYPTDHDTLVDLAAEEQDNDARPAIKDSIFAHEILHFFKNLC